MLFPGGVHCLLGRICAAYYGCVLPTRGGVLPTVGMCITYYGGVLPIMGESTAYCGGVCAAY